MPREIALKMYGFTSKVRMGGLMYPEISNGSSTRTVKFRETRKPCSSGTKVGSKCRGLPELRPRDARQGTRHRIVVHTNVVHQLIGAFQEEKVNMLARIICAILNIWRLLTGGPAPLRKITPSGLGQPAEGKVEKAREEFELVFLEGGW